MNRRKLATSVGHSLPKRTQGRFSDTRLERLVRESLLALEDPAAGLVFDDFDARYREAERLHEKKSAAWFYRDKRSFETKYAEDCGKDGMEPAWTSDRGEGAETAVALVSYALDGAEREPLWLDLWRRKRLQLTKKRRAVHDALAVDWRSRPAAKLAGVSQPTVDLCKKIFKTHFAQCHKAWKRDFAF